MAESNFEKFKLRNTLACPVFFVFSTSTTTCFQLVHRETGTPCIDLQNCTFDYTSTYKDLGEYIPCMMKECAPPLEMTACDRYSSGCVRKLKRHFSMHGYLTAENLLFLPRSLLFFHYLLKSHLRVPRRPPHGHPDSRQVLQLFVAL